MQDDLSYDRAMYRSDPDRPGRDDHTIQVRVIVTEGRHPRGLSRRSRTKYRYVVVDHDAAEVLYVGRMARQYDENPSPTEEAARARGFKQGYLAARE